MFYQPSTEASSPPYKYETVIQSSDEYVTLQNTKWVAFNQMDLLEGWCSKNKASILIDFVFMLKPKVVVELGVFGGKSLVPMAAAVKALNCGKVYGIDPWSRSESIVGMTDADLAWWGNINHDWILYHLQTRISEFGLNDTIKLLRQSSEEASPIANIDLIHIDGNHSEETSYFDVTKWVPMVRPGGVIIFDDIDWPTTAKAVRWLDDNCTRMVDFKETNNWGVWIKK